MTVCLLVQNFDIKMLEINRAIYQVGLSAVIRWSCVKKERQAGEWFLQLLSFLLW